MILTRNILYTALAIYLLASVAFAEKTDAPEAAIIVPVEQTNPVALGLSPGTWHGYRLSGGPTDGAALRWTWLETEEHNGRTYQWFETQLTTPNRRLVTKLLANPARLSEAPRAVLMKVNDTPAQSMPNELRQKAIELLNYAGQTPANSVADETIKVIAGTYATQLYTVVANGLTQKIYLSAELPGIVLTETSDFRMELIATGSDGISAIQEKPGSASQQRKPDTD